MLSAEQTRRVAPPLRPAFSSFLGNIHEISVLYEDLNAESGRHFVPALIAYAKQTNHMFEKEEIQLVDNLATTLLSTDDYVKKVLYENDNFLSSPYVNSASLKRDLSKICNELFFSDVPTVFSIAGVMLREFGGGDPFVNHIKGRFRSLPFDHINKQACISSMTAAVARIGNKVAVLAKLYDKCVGLYNVFKTDAVQRGRLEQVDFICSSILLHGVELRDVLRRRLIRCFETSDLDRLCSVFSIYDRFDDMIRSSGDDYCVVRGLLRGSMVAAILKCIDALYNTTKFPDVEYGLCIKLAGVIEDEVEYASGHQASALSILKDNARKTYIALGCSDTLLCETVLSCNSVNQELLLRDFGNSLDIASRIARKNAGVLRNDFLIYFKRRFNGDNQGITYAQFRLNLFVKLN
jgi:hypothetical protein